MLRGALRNGYRSVRPRLGSALRASGYPRIITREDLLETPDPDWTVFPYGSESAYELAEPLHVGELPSGVAQKVGRHTVPQPFVLECPGVELVGPTALPITADGRYLLEAQLGSTHRIVDALVRSAAARQLPVHSRVSSVDRQYDTPLFSLVGPWCEEFFHWFADYLPRISALEHYEAETGRTPDVLVPADPPAWLSASLDLLDVPAERRVYWSGGRMSVSRLILGSVPRHTETSTDTDGYIHSPEAIRRTAQRLRDAADIDGGGADRLYVSRADAEDRHVVNESELLDVAKSFGFERVQPETLSLSEQIAQFGGADAVLGPHGAGLLNFLYADDPTVIELFGSYQNPCFFALAEGLGLEYATTVCTPEGEDMRVDPDVLHRLLEAALGAE